MSEWYIPEMKPGESNRRNPSALVGCRIVEDAAHNAYVFVAQDGRIESVAERPPRPTDRFNFPVFSAVLNGPIRQNWYISVETLRTGASGNIAWGYFGHNGYHPPNVEDPTDTWVAQAGASVGDDKCDEAAAAASGKQ
jgi:hypothetical protein